jgi:hypothetical protein
MPSLVGFLPPPCFFPPARISALDAAPAVSALSAMQRLCLPPEKVLSDAFLATTRARGGRDAGTAGLSALLAPTICYQKKGWPLDSRQERP